MREISSALYDRVLRAAEGHHSAASGATLMDDLVKGADRFGIRLAADVPSAASDPVAAPVEPAPARPAQGHALRPVPGPAPTA